MSQHVFYSSEDEYLAHSLKGLARKIHKYLLRIKNSSGKGYRYFYSQAEIDAYMKKLKGQSKNKKDIEIETETAYFDSNGKAFVPKTDAQKENLKRAHKIVEGTSSYYQHLKTDPNASKYEISIAYENMKKAEKNLDEIINEAREYNEKNKSILDIFRR